MTVSRFVRYATDFETIQNDPIVDPRDEGLICDLISREVCGCETLLVGLARILPGQYHLRHHHPEGTEFYLIVKGSCTVHVGGEDVEAGYGTCVYMPPNTVHAIKNNTDEICELVYGFDKPKYSECGLVYDE